jgi:hypothetical protein
MQLVIELVTVGQIDPVLMRTNIFNILKAANTGGTLMQTTDSGAITDIHIRPATKAHSNRER